MIPMKCRQKISAALAVILLMLPFMIVFASASSYADFEREVSLEITDIPFANMKFYAYFVAEFDKNGKLTPDGDFESLNLGLESELDYSSLSDILSKKVLTDGMSPDHTALSDEYGLALFDGPELNQGLYIIMSEKFRRDDKVYSMSPFAVTLPFEYGNETGYDVFASAKFDVSPALDLYTVYKVWDDEGSEDKRPPKIDIMLYCDGEIYDEISLPHEGSWKYEWHDLPADHTWWIEEKEVTDYKASISQNGTSFTITNKFTGNPPEEDVPSTGQLWWPVPILLCVGLLFVSVGVIRRTRA